MEKKKILVVDDDHDIAELLASRLRKENYDVRVAYDGMWAIAQTIKENPDLIILDIMMPAGDGISVYDALKKSAKTGTIPVIFITAYPSDQVQDKVLKMGAEGFISKPFKAGELLETIKRVLGE